MGRNCAVDSLHHEGNKEMKKDHEVIWLEPEPPKDNDEIGRTWCQDDVYDPDDYDGNKPTRYIRADLCMKPIPLKPGAKIRLIDPSDTRPVANLEGMFTTEKRK